MTATIAKEKPIIFTGRSVPAILDGRKTQTRRVAKDIPDWVAKVTPWSDGGVQIWNATGDGMNFRESPYGKPGDRLYAKESWSPDHAAFYPNFPVVYRADNCVGDIENGKVYSPEVDDYFPFRWRSPLFMPRRLSRLSIEITEVRVERLHSITEEDAKAEGFGAWTHRTMGTITARSQFAERWAQLNAKRGFSWESNPWVWVVSFRRLEAS